MPGPTTGRGAAETHRTVKLPQLAERQAGRAGRPLRWGLTLGTHEEAALAALSLSCVLLRPRDLNVGSQ